MPTYFHPNIITCLKPMDDQTSWLQCFQLELFIFQGSFGLQFVSKHLDGVRGLVRSFSYGCLSLSAGFLSSFKESE